MNTRYVALLIPKYGQKYLNEQTQQIFLKCAFPIFRSQELTSLNFFLLCNIDTQDKKTTDLEKYFIKVANKDKGAVYYKKSIVPTNNILLAYRRKIPGYELGHIREIIILLQPLSTCLLYRNRQPKNPSMYHKVTGNP